MNRLTRARRVWINLSMGLAGASVLQLLPSCETLLTTVNPCGTIFGFCTPSDLETIFLEIPDFDYDPTCTIPGFGYDPDNPQGNTGGDNNFGCSTVPVYPTSNGNRP